MSARVFLAAIAALATPGAAHAWPAAQVPPATRPPPTPDRVLAFPRPIPGEELHPDRGAAGAWHRIRKLATTASILHVTAHPDDEHSGMLTLASRGWGARTALLSLNRGEAGANAIGPELFDGLGLIRTRELVLSGRYYGLDDLYFTTALDYGYSKSVEEAFRSWDREAVLEDMVRVIRLNRPFAVVSRFHGTRRDGHGNHHAQGCSPRRRSPRRPIPPVFRSRSRARGCGRGRCRGSIAAACAWASRTTSRWMRTATLRRSGPPTSAGRASA